uniref:C-type lectin domain-containing protein n=1 Tax=Varanus komodoensis TaxID=61221 RepID=A0A8D2JCQ3_VARKO
PLLKIKYLSILCLLSSDHDICKLPPSILLSLSPPPIPSPFFSPPFFFLFSWLGLAWLGSARLGSPHLVIVPCLAFVVPGWGEHCSRMGGTLAMPRNAAENSAIQQIVVWHNKRAVLGITDRSTEGRFEYPDGNAISYSNWAPGEPNSAGNEDCVEVHPDAKWHDRSCFLEFLILCEF